MVDIANKEQFVTCFKEIIRMAKQTKQRTVKYPPKKGNLSRNKVKKVVKEVVNTRKKPSTTKAPPAPSKS